MNKVFPLAEATQIDAVRHWLEKAVIGLNLCPFAKAVYAKQQIRFKLANANTIDGLVAALEEELRHLVKADPEQLDTTLLIVPDMLNDFLDFNDFLEIADALVESLGMEGVIQVASFHPRYQFAGTAPEDIENCTNRSPYPILHLLREASVDAAVAAFPDASTIYEKNIARLNELGIDGWLSLLGNPRD